MRYLKWLYLAIWALIYQLPKRTVVTFSSLITVTIVLLFTWLIISPHFVVGPIHAVHHLPGNQHAVVEIGIPLQQSNKLAVLDALEAPDDPIEVLWFLGYGKKQYAIGERSLLLLDSHALFFGTSVVDLKDGKQLFSYLKNIPTSGLIGGILLVLFGMVALQVMTAVMMGVITLVAGWHILYIGNFLDFWFLNDFMIYPVSVMIGVAGAAIGMRTNVGWTAMLFHRLAAVVLVLLFLPLLADQLAITDTTFLLIISMLLTILFPFLAYIAGGSALIAQGLSFNLSESMVILLISLGVGLWLRSHVRPQRLRSYRPFKRFKTMKHGEMQFNTLFKGEKS